MALEFAYGRDLSQSDISTSLPGFVASVGEAKDTSVSQTVVVRGPYSALASHVPAQGTGHSGCSWVPDGYFVRRAILTASEGEATITIDCVAPGGDSSQNPAAPTLIQYQILMSEVQLDLMTHPHITANASAVEECIKWLATDEAQRVVSGDYFYADEDGELQPVNQAEAEDFCAAWLHGIRSYNAYYPIIEKQSTYKRVPGLNMSGLSVSGGTATFSSNIGAWNAPDISLSGYASTGWFKSGDDYRSQGKTFLRNEQWTWTPDGSNSDYSWIYSSGS